MAEFAMTCSCGNTMKIDAADRAEGVAKLQAFMTQEGLDHHFAEKHSASEPKPTLAQTHAMIEQILAPV